jgi:hypothetical protein
MFQKTYYANILLEWLRKSKKSLKHDGWQHGRRSNSKLRIQP